MFEGTVDLVSGLINLIYEGVAVSVSRTDFLLSLDTILSI